MIAVPRIVGGTTALLRIHFRMRIAVLLLRVVVMLQHRSAQASQILVAVAALVAAGPKVTVDELCRGIVILGRGIDPFGVDFVRLISDCGLIVVRRRGRCVERETAAARRRCVDRTTAP